MLHSFSLVDVLGASHEVTPDMVLIPTFKYVKIVPHPLKANKYGVFIVPLPHVPPFFGSLAQCIKAAQVADRHAAELLEK